MLKRFLAAIMRQPLLILALTGLLVGVGAWSAVNLPIDAVPDVTNVQVQVNTNSPSLSPLEVERQITFPIEVAMSGLPDVAEVRSLSKFGLSQVTVVFDDDMNIYFARQLVQERLQQARSEIPEHLGVPMMGPISSGLGEIYQYALTSPQRDLTELRTLQDWVVKPQLRTVPGVAEVNSFGGFERQYQVLVRPEGLVSHGLTLRQVFEAVAANNLNQGGGYIVKGSEQLVIRGVGQVQSLDQIRNVVVTSKGGVPVRVRDVADVAYGPAIRQGAVTQDGNGETVTGITMMLMGANSRTVVAAVKSRVEAVAKSLPPDVKLVPFYDRTELVERTIHTVEKNLFEGAVLVVVVLFLLLGNIRGALIVALAIPLSMLFALSLMVKAGIAGSLMSLGAIDFGLLVDGSVVMVENAVRRLAERKPDASPFGTVLEACAEVGRPIMFGIGIIIVVYLPILTLQGVEGKMFKPMALTVVFALIGSLLLTFTLTPVLIWLGLRHTHEEKENWLLVRAHRLYEPALNWCLDHRHAVLGGAAAAVVTTLAIVPFLGSEFIPRLDEGAIAMQIMRLPSISLEESLQQSSRVEKRLRTTFPDEIATIVSKTGRAEIATDPMGVNVSDVLIMLKPQAGWTQATDKADLEAKIAEAVEVVPGLAFGFSQPIELRVNELIAGVRSDVAIKIYGDDMDVLRRKADEVVAAVSKLPGASEFKAQQVTGLPALEIVVRPEQLARYGINAADVMETVGAIGGVEASKVLDGPRRFDLVVKLPDTARQDPEAIGNLLVSAPGGERVPLGTLATIREVAGPAEISHENGSRLIIVEGNVRGRDIGSFVADARQLFDDRKIVLPTGYRPEFGGQFENLERARTRLFIVVPLSLLLIFLLLFTTFNSLRQAGLVFIGIPLATVGGVFALVLRGMPFSISAGVGFIALFGVAVLNGVVMVSYINKLRHEDGLPLAKAVHDGATTRLRPVLMTALVASLGFIPMAVSTGAGGEVQRPLATVVIGGLVTSTLLTLLVLPMLYLILERHADAPHPQGEITA
jgi:cobalt-zinc-cadmium resistance protein CzcA